MTDVIIPAVISYQGIKVNYTSLNETKDSKLAYEKIGPAEYNLRKFEDYKPSTIVLVGNFEGEIYNYQNLIWLFSVIRSDGKICDPGTITSVRYEIDDPENPGKKLRFQRGDDGGFFKNSAFVNIWTDNYSKHISTKLSNETIHMCGVKSIEMGEQVFKYIFAHIQDAVGFHSLVKAHPEKFLEATQLVIDRHIGPKIQYDTQIIESEDMIMEIPLMEDSIIWPKSLASFEPTQENLVEFFYNEIIRRYAVDVTNVRELKFRSQFILDLEVLVSPGFQIGKLYRVMLNYYYHLNAESKITKRYINEKLYQLGYDGETTFMNTINPKICITTRSCVTVDDINIWRKEH